MATIIKADGTMEHVCPKNGTDFSLNELNNIVNGSIEVIKITPGHYMIVNESGKLLTLPLNRLASTIFSIYTDAEDSIVGDVLICPISEIK